jgi:hypothetical protein
MRFRGISTQQILWNKNSNGLSPEGRHLHDGKNIYFSGYLQIYTQDHVTLSPHQNPLLFLVNFFQGSSSFSMSWDIWHDSASFLRFTCAQPGKVVRRNLLDWVEDEASNDPENGQLSNNQPMVAWVDVGFTIMDYGLWGTSRW